MNILIAEDDEDSRVMLRAVLENCGHQVTSAINGKEALESIKGNRPDLVITDVLMPEMDGYELCRTLKSDPELENIPLIFYTATYTSQNDQELGMLLGGARFLIKPLDPSALTQCIDEVIKENEKKNRSPSDTPMPSEKIISKMHLDAVGKKLQQKREELKDVTQKKDVMGDKLVQMASEVHQINEAIADFTFAASHDLIEPLRKISSFSSRLREIYGEDLDERQQVYLNVIERSSQKLKNNIDGLADFARITNTTLKYETFSLNSIFSEILEKFAWIIRKTDAQIKIEDLHTLTSDKSLTLELFKNLISNGLSFHKEDEPPSIHVTSRLIDNDHIEVTLEDSGIGFEEKYISKIFKPFQQLQKNQKSEGSGVGLTICQKIVIRLGGSISVKSAPGEGSTFFINLPLKPEENS
jgi:signal transduction histidine kinase